jgi:hypothetical protein
VCPQSQHLGRENRHVVTVRLRQRSYASTSCLSRASGLGYRVVTMV